MDAIYQRGRANAADVRAALPDAPGYSAVRALLAILVNKGFLKIERDGPRYAYIPTRPRGEAGRSAIRRIVDTFFEGSLDNAVTALLDSRSGKLTDAETGRLKALIDQARKSGR